MVIALALMPVNAVYLVLAEIMWLTTAPTALSLFYNVMFALFWLVLVNLAVTKIKPAWALRPGEFFVIYTHALHRERGLQHRHDRYPRADPRLPAPFPAHRAAIRPHHATRARMACRERSDGHDGLIRGGKSPCSRPAILVPWLRAVVPLVLFHHRVDHGDGRG